MEITLFKKEFKELSAWAYTSEYDVKAEIKFSLMINKHVWFSFVTRVVNKSFQSKNPFKSLLMSLESETIGMAKYDLLKERIRCLNLWNRL